MKPSKHQLRILLHMSKGERIYVLPKADTYKRRLGAMCLCWLNVETYCVLIERGLIYLRSEHYHEEKGLVLRRYAITRAGVALVDKYS